MVEKKKTHFIWLSDSCYPRRGGKLIKGETYKISDYPEAVVAEWVKTKVAKYVSEQSKNLIKEK